VLDNQSDVKYFDIKFPVIVKSATEHGSVSVSQASVVTTNEELRKQCDYLFEKFQGKPIIAEQYIDGRELNAVVVGSFDWTECLPLSEVKFGKSFKNGKWPICTYDGNYVVDSSDYNESVPYLVNDLDRKTEKTIFKNAIKAAIKTKCFDYCRIDIRFDIKQNKAYFVDINSYPCLKDDPLWDTITISRRAKGWTFLDYLERIAESGIKRNKLLNIKEEQFAYIER
jgi:D-alanine-D-alanine ligase